MEPVNASAQGSPAGCADTPSVRQRKTENILDAALRAFLDAGYGATTVDTIAAAAGVSKATLYTRFPSKQALFAAVIRRECRACSLRMRLVEDAPVDDFRNALQRIAETLLDIFAEPQNLAILRLVLAEIPRFPELGTLFYDAGPAVTRDNLVEFLRRHRTQLRPCTAESAAQDLISLLRGDMQIRALLGVGDLSIAARKRIAERAVDAFLSLYAVA